METLAALTSRRSIRKYQARPVPREVLLKALDAARMAPTARNEQPWEFIAVTGPEKLARLAAVTDHGKFIAGAPACVAIVCRDTKYYLEDGTAAVVNLLNALHAQGVGACWVAGDKKPYAPQILQILGVAGPLKLIALVPCGFPAETPRLLKRGLESMLHWEKFA